MIEFTVAGQQYRSGKLDARRQFHVARRLAPVFSGFANGEMTAIAQAIAAMPEADADHVLSQALSVVERQQGTMWVRVQASNGSLMFEDVDLLAMMQIAWEVLRDNLAGFFLALPSISPEAAEPTSTP